jgi:hypothetical protein
VNDAASSTLASNVFIFRSLTRLITPTSSWESVCSQTSHDLAERRPCGN